MHLEENKTKTQLNMKKAVFFNGDFEISDSKDSWLRYAINGVLMFYISYGCLATFVSAFSIEHYSVVLFFVMLILALLYSFMHISEKAHKIGYGCILLTYVYIIIRGKTIIKSGFATLINETFKEIQDKLSLARIKQYTEYVDETKMAVTMCVIILGFVLLLILNILISEYVNVLGTILLTAPIVIGCFYFEEKPNLLPLIMYVAGIMGLIIIRINGKVALFINKNDYYVDKTSNNEKKKYKYNIASRLHAHILAIVMIFVTVLSGVFGIVLRNNYKNSIFVKAVLKKTTDNIVADVVTDTGNGGSKTVASGGLGRGKLGKVGKIEYDNETDIKVRFVPTDEETLYLRGYIGSIYENNSWKVLSRAKNTKYLKLSKEIHKIHRISPGTRTGYSFNLLKSTPMSLFTIINVNGDGEYAYMPYYAELNDNCMEARNDDEIYMTVNAESYEVRYHPNSEIVERKIDNGEIGVTLTQESEMNTYYEYIKKIFTQVPDKNEEALKSVCDSIGIYKKNTYSYNEIVSIVGKIQKYFEESYIYSISPGETPQGKDYVKYFIETKKGFCAHFASTGALLLRYLGIPARYVEGYLVTNDLVSKGKRIQVEDISKYTNDYTNMDKGVIEVEVPDNKAHAWIEIYKEDFGWVPYEMTVYNSREDTREGNVAATEEKIKKFKKSLVDTGINIGIILIVSTCSILLVYLVVAIRYIRKKRRRNKSFKNENKSEAICCVYMYLSEAMKFFGVKRDAFMTVDEYFRQLVDMEVAKKDILKDIALKINKATYSNEEILEGDLDYVKTNVENIIKIKYNNLGLKQKILFKYVYNL